MPYPIRQPVVVSLHLHLRSVNVDELQNYFVLPYTTIGTRNCAVNMRSVDLDSWEVSFSSTVNLFNTWMEAI